MKAVSTLFAKNTGTKAAWFLLKRRLKRRYKYQKTPLMLTVRYISSGDTNMNENIMKSVYIETTIPSYATGRMSRDIITANRQSVTKLFWENERKNYNLFISKYVIDECSQGDPEAANRRLNFIKNIRVIPETIYIAQLADLYFNMLSIPERAKADCVHLAVCVDAKIDYLLSWNCTHLGTLSYAKVYK
jgi:hypothetical protein